MIRGLSIELRGHIGDPLWASFWDAMFFIGSALLAIFFGAALGNVVRGVPLNADGYFFQPLWTDFSPFTQNPGILDWYTVLIGLLALTTLVVHGANFIAVKTEDELNARSRRISRLFTFATIALDRRRHAGDLLGEPAGCSTASTSAPTGTYCRSSPSRGSPGWSTSTSGATTGRPSSPPAPTSSGC